MVPARVAPEDRVAYHAAAAMAANFLVALEAAAERLAATAGVTRAQLAPLVLATAAQWAELGPEAALTGPIARGDEEVVARHRAAIAERTPELLPLFDALAAQTRVVRGGAGMKILAHDRRRPRVLAAPRPGSVGLVPTMGAFHAGHHALMRAARERHDTVIVSLFVNPAQFNDAGDLAAYPRTEEQDAAEAEGLGVDVLFAPPVTEIYPAGFATSVTVAGLGEVYEGAERGPGHFAGVCTVVAKLLNIVAPDVAYFGQKDAQQVAVVQRMVRDLDIPVQIAVRPTVREPDGLALSSRNVRLSPPDRAQALGAQPGPRRRQARLRRRRARRPRARAGRPRRAQRPRPRVRRGRRPRPASPRSRPLDGPALIAVAAHVGPVRLIDNVPLDPVAT